MPQVLPLLDQRQRAKRPSKKQSRRSTAHQEKCDQSQCSGTNFSPSRWKTYCNLSRLESDREIGAERWPDLRAIKPPCDFIGVLQVCHKATSSLNASGHC